MGCPKKFLCAIPFGLVAGLLIFMVAVRIQLGVPTASSAWVHEIIDRKQRAAESITEPKLVLLGGSATLFGIKASVLESELGVPVINGGLHAGLGMACILREGKKMLRPGDTVMLFPEYELLSFGEKNRRQWAAITYLDYILSRNSNHYLTLSLADQIEIALMTPATRIIDGIKGRWFPVKLMHITDHNMYEATSISQSGDMNGHISARRPEFASDRDRRVCEVLLHGLSLEEEGFSLIREFTYWADARQVRIIAGYPNMVRRSIYEPSMVDGVERQLKLFYSKHGIVVIGGLLESLMPTEDFFDTIYHPTEEASLQISKRLAVRISQFLASSSE